MTIFKEQLYLDLGSERCVELAGGPPTTQDVIAGMGSMLAACVQDTEGVHLEFNHYKEARHRSSDGRVRARTQQCHERSSVLLCHDSNDASLSTSRPWLQNVS